MPGYVYDFVEGNKDLQGSARRQGRQPGRDDPDGAAGAARFHHHAPRRAATTCAPARCRTGCSPRSTDTCGTMETRMGKLLGDRGDPLLLSVRSGGKFSMPGMMETILDIGLNDASVAGLAAQSGDERFAWDSYRRLIQMFGKTVFDVPGEEFEAELSAARDGARRARRRRSSARPTCATLVEAYKKVFHEHTGRDFPQAPHEQLYLAIASVFRSWNAERAVLYRRQERIPQDLGTAVNVMAMVFGNRGAGLRHRRGVHPRPGDRPPRRLRRLPGERPGRGRRRRHPQHRRPARAGEHRPGELPAAAVHHGPAGAALPRPVRHRVHHRARQAVDAADPGRQAHARPPRSSSPPSWSTRVSSPSTRPCNGSPASSSPS